MEVLFGLMYAWMAFAIIADYISTVKGMDKGMTEANPIARWMFKKVGISLTTFIGGAAATFIGCIFGSQGLLYGAVFYGIVAAAETIVATRNYLLFVKGK